MKTIVTPPNTNEDYHTIPIDMGGVSKGWYACIMTCGPYRIVSHTILQ